VKSNKCSSPVFDIDLTIDPISYCISYFPCKVSFHYLKYEINNLKTQVERRKGKPYIVSPYKLLINEGNYYLLA